MRSEDYIFFIINLERYISVAKHNFCIALVQPWDATRHVREEVCMSFHLLLQDHVLRWTTGVSVGVEMISSPVHLCHTAH